MHALDDRAVEKGRAELEHRWQPPPVPARLLRRRRLHAIVEEGLRGPVTVVVAPPGFGKTRLLAGFSDTEQRAGRRVRWLSADQHADLGLVLLEARALPLPHRAPRARTSRGRVAHLLTGAATAPTTEPPDVVVVDDADLLGPAELTLLGDVLNRDPTSVRIVLLARRNPLDVSLQFALGDLVTVIRGRQLLFDETEARQLILLHAPDGTSDDVAAIIHAGHGWAVPLVMGARALAASEGDPAYVFRLEHVEQQVLDHLLGDCFTSMSAPVCHVVVACSQEDDVDARAALALSGTADTASHFSALVQDGLMTVSIDPRRTGGLVWRCHPLLKEALRRLTAPTGPNWALVVEGHIRAAHHYAADEDAVRALRHAHRSGDAATVTEMLTRYATLLSPSAAAGEVAAGLLCLPDAVKAAAPHLLAIDVLLQRARGRLDLALTQAHHVCDAEPAEPPTPAQAAIVTSVRLWLASLGWGQADAAVREGQRLLGCRTDAGHTHAPNELSMAQSACLMLELAAAETWGGDLASAAVHLHEAERLADVLSSAALRGSAMALRCVLELAAGAYRTAADTAAAALAADPTSALPADVRARALIASGWTATYALNPRAARTALKELAAHPEPVDPVARTMLTLLRCRVLNQDGAGAEALRLLASSRTLEEAPPFLIRLAGVIEAETAARAQSSTSLRAATDRLRAHGFDDEAELFACVGHREPSAVSAALVRLDALLAKAELHPATGAGAAAVRMSLVLQHVPGQAHVLLPDFLGRVHPQRLLVFLDLAAKISPTFMSLLLHDVETGPSHPLAAEALVVLRRTHDLPHDDTVQRTGLTQAMSPTPTQTAAAPQSAGPDLAPHTAELDVVVPIPRREPGEPVVDLTPRQKDVLAQLAAGASHSDIAQNLYLTKNTVKTQLTALYRKLEVNRRSEALRRARELGLI